MANFTPSYMHHDTSAGAPAITLFGTGGSSGAGPGAKTVGGTGASGRGVSTVQYGPLDDNAMAVRRALPCSQPDTLLPGEKIFQTCPSVSTSWLFFISTSRGPLRADPSRRRGRTISRLARPRWRRLRRGCNARH